MKPRIIEIHKRPDTIVEGSGYERQIKRFPHVANHDRREGIEEGNDIFAEHDPQAVNPIKVHEMEIEEGQLLSVVAKLMLAEDRSRPIQMFLSQLNELHASDTWRLWCCKYEIIEELQAAYFKVFGVALAYSDLETLKTQVREQLKETLAK
jgi:hypothetical protein